MYINNSKSDPLMIERISYSKVYLYRAERVRENLIKWNLIRQIENFDADLESDGCDFLVYVPFYSPDFSYHIEMNRKEKCFNIRETITNKFIKTIPKDLMYYDAKMLPVETVNRMQWIDNRLIRIVNVEGIEKIVDFQDGFKEIAFNSIPAFIDSDLVEGFKMTPYYYEREALDLDNTEKWLERKYQQYKSAYYLLNKHDFVSLNEVLFTVERRML